MHQNKKATREIIKTGITKSPESATWTLEDAKERTIDLLEWVWLSSPFKTKKATFFVEKLDDLLYEIQKEAKREQKEN